MLRWVAGIAAVLLLITGSVLALAGNAEGPPIPPAPQPRLATSPTQLSPIPAAPEADPKSKEEKRFDRSDKDRDGRIAYAELVEPRRKAFAKLDANRDGTLSFEEWADKTIDKFNVADANRDRALSRSEYATTAPKPRKKPACSC